MRKCSGCYGAVGCSWTRTQITTQTAAASMTLCWRAATRMPCGCPSSGSPWHRLAQGASRCPSHGDAPSSAALTCTLRSPSHPTTATLWSGSALWSLAQALIACTITASWHLRRGTDRRSCRSLTWSPVLSSGCSIARSSPLGAGFSRFLEGMADSTPVNNALLCRPTVYFNALLYMAALKINALLRTLQP